MSLIAKIIQWILIGLGVLCTLLIIPTLWEEFKLPFSETIKKWFPNRRTRLAILWVAIIVLIISPIIVDRVSTDSQPNPGGNEENLSTDDQPHLILFQETFEDQSMRSFDVIEGPWDIVEVEEDNSVLEIDATWPNNLLRFGNLNQENCSISYRFRYLSEVGTGRLWLYYGEGPISGQTTLYKIEIEVHNESITLLHGDPTPTEHDYRKLVTESWPFEPETWYQVFIEHQEQEIKVYIDDSLVIRTVREPSVVCNTFTFSADSEHWQIDDIRVFLE